MLISREAIERGRPVRRGACSPTARTSTGRSARAPAGRRVVVVPASVVRHRVSASTGGESSPTSLYYDVRNGLVVSERYAPLGRVRHGAAPRRVGAGPPGAGRRCPIAASRRCARCSPAGATRVAGASAAGRCRVAPMSGMLHRDPGLWLMLHLRHPAIGRATARALLGLRQRGALRPQPLDAAGGARAFVAGGVRRPREPPLLGVRLERPRARRRRRARRPLRHRRNVGRRPRRGGRLPLAAHRRAQRDRAHARGARRGFPT